MMVNTPKAVPKGIWRQSSAAITRENVRCRLCLKKTGREQVQHTAGEHGQAHNHVKPDENPKELDRVEWRWRLLSFPHVGIGEKGMHKRIVEHEKANPNQRQASENKMENG